ncbi:MAG: hypothetical protein IK127_02885 [Clostridia bacterium]|nr:hypothetical protein [Clostridia bacterium]
MFKLLLATDDPEVLQAYGEINDWERLGYRQPRTASTADEATDSLTHHHADAVIIALPPVEEKKLLHAMTCEHWHLRPILSAGRTREEILRDLVELELLLSRTHADYSNDPYNEETMMQLSRHDFFRKVIAGKEPNEEHLRHYLRLLRSRMDPDRPCLMMQFELPDDDDYLSAHWHYGPDRLETAMRNIFGAELSGVRFLVSVLDDERIFLLACPMLEHETPDMDTLRTIVREHVEWAIRHVQEYLNIDMKILSSQEYPSLVDMAQQRAQAAAGQ